MGHYTVTGKTIDEALKTADTIKQIIKIIGK